jgi:hypothetical protein
MSNVCILYEYSVCVCVCVWFFQHCYLCLLSPPAAGLLLGLSPGGRLLSDSAAAAAFISEHTTSGV